MVRYESIFFWWKNRTVKGQREDEINIANKNKAERALEDIRKQCSRCFAGGQKKGIKGELLLVKKAARMGTNYLLLPQKNNGTFSASLPDGNYNLWSITIEGGVYPYNLAFSVEGNDVYINGEKNNLAMYFKEW
ncbi:hypothetical protein GCM10020331_065020 [Ectobacillus funiculus]